ncbi:hypothetical protein GCM10010517_15850 [Streptosporangium fragile]|uniref:Uncharacterized protein n=1 Tax=Streptosporangium fragile TaxID=46186 RepID=A0ABP6I941_9ACTN
MPSKICGIAASHGARESWVNSAPQGQHEAEELDTGTCPIGISLSRQYVRSLPITPHEPSRSRASTGPRTPAE